MNGISKWPKSNPGTWSDKQADYIEPSSLTLQSKEYNEYPSIITATTTLSGKELAYSLNFPQKSVSGLPILECAEFGRNVVTYDAISEDGKKFALGKVFHMNHEENNQVGLSLNSLASHTFITGSTGSGKSNTIYQILDKARDKGAHFLVIEPAKGEYKNVFGKEEDTAVHFSASIAGLLQDNYEEYAKLDGFDAEQVDAYIDNALTG